MTNSTSAADAMEKNLVTILETPTAETTLKRSMSVRRKLNTDHPVNKKPTEDSKSTTNHNSSRNLEQVESRSDACAHTAVPAFSCSLKKAMVTGTPCLQE